MERYYSDSVVKNYLKMILDMRDSIGEKDYEYGIKQVQVKSSRSYLKSSSLDVAESATSRIDYVQNRLDSLHDTIASFQREVDDTASAILVMATNILEIIEENNRALTEIQNALYETGTFAGKKVTPDTLKSVGLDTDKIAEKKANVWNLLFNLSFDPNNLPDERVINAYLENLKKKANDGIPMTDEEKQNVINIYNGICINRHGKTGDIRDMSDLAIQNGIDAFELLYPAAVGITTYYFWDALKNGDETVLRNVSRIKYEMYTAKPEYRDVMLYYLLYTNKMSYQNKGTDSYWGIGTFNGLYIDLTINFDEWDSANNRYKYGSPFGSFFHELGHGIDDVSKILGCTSDGFDAYLENDLRKSMEGTIAHLHLSDEKEKEVIDFILGPQNVNVAEGRNDPNGPYYLPTYWTDKQVEAFNEIRKRYGYLEYFIEDGKVQYIAPSKGNNTDGFAGTINSDIVGGLTNNQVGGTGQGHRYEFPSSAGNMTTKDLKNKLSGYYYWKVPTCVGKEFFAEAYDFGVQGTNTTPTRNIFSSSYAEYDKRIREIYNKIPHIEF